MRRVALHSDGETSCLIASVLSELSTPCGSCTDMEGITLSGKGIGGEQVTVRLLPGSVLEIEGADSTVDAFRERRCPYGQ